MSVSEREVSERGRRTLSVKFVVFNDHIAQSLASGGTVPSLSYWMRLSSVALLSFDILCFSSFLSSSATRNLRYSG
jgi:hypothetical protein